MKKEFELSRNEYIEQLSLKSNEVHISTGNKKTGRACMDFALPTISCREDAPCKKDCYACKGCQQIANVQAAYYRNYRLMMQDINDLFEQIKFKIIHNGLSQFRFFDSGDIPNYEFLIKMIELAKNLPDIKFMAFTKKYELVNKALDEGYELPNNLNIIFSAWDKNWKFDNPYNLPIAYVDFKNSSLNPDIPKDAFRCPSSGKKLGEITCSMCKACWKKDIKAVVFQQH